MAVASTNLERGAGNTEDSLRNCVQLTGVNVLLVLCGGGRTDLCEDGGIINRPVQAPLYRFARKWGVFL
jgi:hypothetical protein